MSSVSGIHTCQCVISFHFSQISPSLHFLLFTSSFPIHSCQWSFHCILGCLLHHSLLGSPIIFSFPLSQLIQIAKSLYTPNLLLCLPLAMFYLYLHFRDIYNPLLLFLDHKYILKLSSQTFLSYYSSFPIMHIVSAVYITTSLIACTLVNLHFDCMPDLLVFQRT